MDLDILYMEDMVCNTNNGGTVVTEKNLARSPSPAKSKSSWNINSAPPTKKSLPTKKPNSKPKV